MWSGRENIKLKTSSWSLIYIYNLVFTVQKKRLCFVNFATVLSISAGLMVLFTILSISAGLMVTFTILSISAGLMVTFTILSISAGLIAGLVCFQNGASRGINSTSCSLTVYMG